MNPDCGIIKDLLPLYAENLCGEESRAAVEKHLEGCESCRTQLAELQKQEIVQPAPTLPLETIYLKIRRSRLRIVALAVCLMLFAVTALQGRSQQLHPAAFTSPDDFQFTRLATGELRMVYDKSLQVVSLSGYQMTLEPGTEPLPFVYTVMFEKRDASGRDEDGRLPFLSSIFHQQPSHSQLLDSHGNQPVRVYFLGPDGKATLLYADPAPDEAEQNGGLYMLPRLALNFYAWVMLGLLCLIGAGWLVCLKLRKEKARRILSIAFLMPLSYLLAQLAVKGLSGVSWDMGMDLQYILSSAAFAFGAMLLGLRQYRQSRG